MICVNETPISEIPSSAVPFTLPVCDVHDVLTYVHKTRRPEELEDKRLLRVCRMCRCDECHRLGVADIAVVNFRIFPM